MTLANMIKVSTGIISIVATLFFVYGHFAKAEELQNLKAYTEYTFDELQLERIEDKINLIEVKPELKLEPWEREKLLRLRAQYKRIIRRIDHNEGL